VDHPEAGVGVKRTQSVAAAAVAVLLLGGAAYAERELGPRPLDAATPGASASGAWYCPHSGGEGDWEVALQVANPGDEPATVRVRSLGSRRPSPLVAHVVDPGSFLTIPVPTSDRERSSAVEWFDQWVAVGWISHAGGDEGGVAAEPCAPAAGPRWFLPDGTSETDEHDDYVIVMNPFARDAVFSVVLLSDRQDPVIHSRLTDIALPAFRSRAIRLNSVVEGERTVSSVVEVSVGRVAAGSLGVVTTGGVRSAIGYLGAPSGRLTFPGGNDAGRSDLVVMSTAEEHATLAAELLEKETEQPFAGLAESVPPARSGRTYPVTTTGPTSIAFSTEGGGVAASRRTFGVVSDQGVSNGAVPGRAWIVLSGVSGSPSHPGIALANPGDVPAEVRLSYLSPAQGEAVTVTIPPRRTVLAPKAFVEAAPRGAVLSLATSGTFVPGSASYSRGRDGFATFATALGIPIPAGWAPA